MDNRLVIPTHYLKSLYVIAHAFVVPHCITYACIQIYGYILL